ncbi:MAG TPA: 6-pyruvoyl-tetrahydropterin synthase-related protein, partial [Vicinamibacteria bacterium]|nr:6-pyruvoyl-tetrahydropterin synthase-related protein [Vicinamibacteria bacterium]
MTLRRPGWPLVATRAYGLLAVAFVFNAIALAPEARIGSVPVNDVAFHLAATQRLGQSVARGEPFLDPWVSEWALGHPLWRTYQPLPHLFGALVLWATHGRIADAGAFAALFYALLVTLPGSVYLGGRLLGLSRPAAGLAALLVFAPVSAGGVDGYGLGYGSAVWRGSGLYTQVVAMHLLALSLGMTARALDGRRRAWPAALLLALTALSHVVFGYVALASAAPIAFMGARGRRSQRLARLLIVALGAGSLLAWFVVPLALDRSIVQRSRWEDPFKWDSYGARFVLGELFSGRLLDADRLPVFTALLAAGIGGAVLARRRACARRLLALTVLWLALFFGRETWGHLLLLLGVPAELHLHRLLAVFELCAALLAAFGIDQALRRIRRANRPLAVVAAFVIAAAIASIGVERWRYLAQNRAWGEDNLAAHVREQADVEASLQDVRTLLDRTPGRVSAGLANTWGRDFRVGWTPVYALLTLDHLDQASFLYHSMSAASDVMVVRDEADAGHDRLFGVRAVVAPAERPMPPHLQPTSVHGRFAVYESSPEGYFGLVDVAAHYTGPSDTRYEVSSAWLKSALPQRGVVVSLDPRLAVGPALARWQPLPVLDEWPADHRGRIMSETKDGETYRCTVELDRPAYVLAKLTWNPHLRATIDGARVSAVRVTPGFAAVPAPTGRHQVELRYRPGPLKPWLLVIGIAVFAIGARASTRQWIVRAESRLATGFAKLGARLAAPRLAATGVLLLLAALALHALFRGRLVAGHDATAYPPRLVELERAVSDGHVPPLWAPDLGAGHGQPLFEFVPPLVYAVALVPRAVGLGLADSLQIGLALLCLAGAVAVYRLGRALGADRPPAVVGVLTWLFAPYLCTDLYVRAAFAESAALAVLPLALLGVVRAVQKPCPCRVVEGTAAIALVPLSHNAVALLALPALGLVALLGGRRAGATVSGVAAVGGGLGLSAYFWLPALLETGLVHTARLRGGALNWADHFAEFRPLLWPAWDSGHSVRGTGDGMSFALVLAHVCLGVAGYVLARRSPRLEVRRLALAFAT